MRCKHKTDTFEHNRNKHIKTRLVEYPNAKNPPFLDYIHVGCAISTAVELEIEPFYKKRILYQQDT